MKKNEVKKFSMKENSETVSLLLDFSLLSRKFVISLRFMSVEIRLIAIEKNKHFDDLLSIHGYVRF